MITNETQNLCHSNFAEHKYTHKKSLRKSNKKTNHEHV